MIIWLASYPRSGNTWIRALLSNYLYSKEPDTLKNLESIDLFPSGRYFSGLIDKKKINENKKDIFKNYILAQEKINLNKKINIIKTHCFAGKVEGSEFSNSENTAGFIYIIRDPRSVAVSNSYHEEISISKSVDQILNPKRFSNVQELYMEFRSSWQNNYLSWKNKKWEGLFIKYEDLHNDTFNNLKKIIIFMKKFVKIEIDEKKIKETIELSSFNNLSKIEKKLGFKENPSKEKFFRKGLVDEWKKSLSKDLIIKIEENFKNEMKELNYL